MASIPLTDSQSRAKFFRQTALNNLRYWQSWLEVKINDAPALDRERNAIVKAISFAFQLEEAWPLVFELAHTLSPFMERRGHWEMWHWVLTRALDAAGRSQDMAAEVTLAALLARLLFQQSRLKEATARYRQTIHLARRIGDQFNEARACTNLGFYFIEQGYWYRAEVLCCHALELFEQLDSDHGRAHTENHLGFLYTRQHRWEQARRRLERACEFWRAMDDRYGLILGLLNLGGLHLRMAQPNKALKHLEEALYLAELIGDETTIGRIYLNIGHANLIDGELLKAETYTRQAETIFRQFSNTSELARVWGNLGTIYSRQSKWREAISYLEKSLEGWRSLNNKIDEINTLMDMVEYELARGNRQRAVGWLQEAEQLIGPDHKNAPYRHLQPRLAEIRHNLAELSLRQATTG